MKENGYPALAQLLGPHSSMAMFKRFSRLSAHSLLMRQVELLDLERQLEVQAALDRDDGLKYDVKAIDLLQSSEHNGQQWQIIKSIRENLDQYHTALLKHSQICKLPKPNRYDLNLLQDWLARADGGNNFLTGIEDLPWLESESSDLVALDSRDFDSATRWFAERVLPWLYRNKVQSRSPLPGQEELGLVEWSDETYRRAARWLSVIASTCIPTLAIVVLYFIRNLIARILTAMGLSFVFSVSLALLTAARPAEIFAASAAFAAVQVVFIGSTSLSASQQ
ncbi:unnamed protein product [Cercospora beticola]|nr:unnamed protein product [Cercospora beticola]